MLKNTGILSNTSIKKLLGFLMVVLCTILPSCVRNQAGAPISFEKMGAVLADLQIAESYSNFISDTLSNEKNEGKSFNKNYDSLYSFYSSVLQHHHLSYNEFASAIQWYKKHPEQMDSMMNQAIEALNRQKILVDQPVEQIDRGLIEGAENNKKDFGKLKIKEGYEGEQNTENNN